MSILPPGPAEGDPAAGYRPVDQAASVAGNRSWWDAEASDYYAEHGAFLGDRALVWGPEGLTEDVARLLGDVHDHTLLEIGGGAGQGARWAVDQGARVVTSDLSGGMLRQGRVIDRRCPGAPAPAYVQCDAVRLPFADASFDGVFSAYGAVPFVADSAGLMREVARVLRPAGRWVFSVTHPVRWAFPDVPGEAGLTVHRSYFDTTPYVESRGARVTYAEHHRTLGQRVREIVAAGLVLRDLVEPEWPSDNPQTWGGWSPERGRLLPGTAIFVTERARQRSQSCS